MTTNLASRKTAHLTANPRVALLVHDWVSPREDRVPEGEASGGGGAAADPAVAAIPPLHPPSEQEVATSSQQSAPRPRRHADTNSDEARRRPSSSLASMLLGFNRAALGRISVTVAGTARVLEQGGGEERWCRARHVESHGFKGAIEEEGEETAQGVSQVSPAQEEGFLEGEDVRVVVVKVREGRIADWKGGVKDFVIRSGDEEREEEANGAS
jgi:hypothetical protein